MRTLTIIAIFIISFSLPALSQSQPPITPFLDENNQALMEEALSLALLHSLKLSPEQRQQIKEILTEMRKDMKSAQSIMEKWNNEVVAPRLKQVISDLQNNRNPSPLSENQLSELHKFRQQLADYRISFRSAMEKILELLTPEQQNNLRLFRPREYLGIPNPLGFAPLGFKPLELIEEVRNMTSDEFQKLVEHLEKTHQYRWKKRKEIARRIQILINFLEKVRNLSEEEFARQYEQLQEQYDQLKPHPSELEKPEPKSKAKFEPRWGKGTKGRDYRPLIERIIMSETFYRLL